MIWVFNRIVYGFVRTFAIGLCIALAANAVPLFVNLRKHPLPRDFLNRKEIYSSQGMTGVLSVILPVWMAVSGIYILNCGSLKKKQYWLVIYCVVDWGMVAMLVLSLVWQSWYLPGTITVCRKPITWKGCEFASRWKVVENNPSLFCQLGSRMNRAPRKLCEQFFRVWVLNICTVIMLGYSAVYPLLRVSIPWPIVWVHGHLVRYLKSAGKLQRMLRSVQIRWRAMFNRKIDNQFQQWRLTRAATLFDILNEDEESRVITSIAHNLHYSDIISLSLTSKANNSAVFPHKTVKGRREQISVAACELWKTECWCCGTEICQSCKFKRNIPEPCSSTHVNNCQPYCSTCYYQVLCRRYVSGAPGPKKGPYFRVCPCRVRAPSHYLLRSVCIFCNALAEGAQVRVREEREKAEMKHLVQQQLRCVVCTRGLNRGGLRWWGCSICNKECVSDFHPAWDEKMPQ